MSSIRGRMAGLVVLAGLVAVQGEGAQSTREQLASMEEQISTLQQEMEQLKSASAAVTGPGFAIGAVRIGGDFRYRHEWTDDATKTADRNRHRIQARVSMDGTVNDSIQYRFRLASGNSEGPAHEGSPTSNNQDLGNAFSSKNVWLDLACVEYRPEAVAGLGVIGGKMSNPFSRVGNSDLLFDTDLTPEGVAATCKRSLAETLEMAVAAGGFYVRERREEAETSLWAVNGAVTAKWSTETTAPYVRLGGGYFNYGNVKGREGLGSDPTQFFGNRALEEGYESDFDLVQGMAELGMTVAGQRIRVFGDVLHNVSAATEADTAYLAGASLGRLHAPGSWAVSYNYRDLDADSLLGVLTEATFAGGGTDVKGHKLALEFMLAKNTQFNATYMKAQRTRGETTSDFDVVMVDLVFRF